MQPNLSSNHIIFLSNNVINFQGGFLYIRHFITKNIKAKKFYQRQGALIKDNSFGLDSDMTIIAPEDEGNYPFSNTDDDFFGDFDSVDDEDK